MASPNVVEQFLMSNGKYFPAQNIANIRQQLSEQSDQTVVNLYALDFKDPILMLIISLFGGSLGIDRFLLGQIGIGVAKLLTGGGCGIWALIDLFLIMDAAKAKNMETLQLFLQQANAF